MCPTVGCLRRMIHAGDVVPACSLVMSGSSRRS
uniref:Uncharacterized protein n=1 Tax=Anopheles dirus TaxID=7168 RepID=A0A182NYZ1_9DIPT